MASADFVLVFVAVAGADFGVLVTGRGTRPTVDNVSCFGGSPLETVGVSVTSDACASSIITGKERPCSSCTTHVLPCGTSVMRGVAGVDLAPKDVVGTPPVVDRKSVV